MARTERTVQNLVEDEPGMADAIAAVLDRAEGGTVSWADVNGDISSGEWGRLIETGVLVEHDGADGGDFAIRDVDQTRAALSDSDPAVAEDDGESDWTVYDKAAAVGALGLFAGYSWAPLRNVIGGAMNLLLGPLEQMLPFYVVILVLALFTGLYSTLLQANLMDMSKMSEYQQRMKDIQRREKEARERGDDEALEEIREEQMSAMGDNLGMFKEQFRPMVWIMLLTIPVFLWMYWQILSPVQAVNPTEITMPLLGTVGWRDGIIGPIEVWIIWYFLCSMSFTQVIRKALHIQTTPT